MPLYGCRVEAGYPSPAEDYLEGRLDLNEHLIRRPAATFFLTVSGESMTGAGIFPNDILVVDRSLEAKHGSIVIAVLDGELTVKRLYRKGGVLRLMPENSQFRPLDIRDEMEFQIWGVVRHAIHSFE